MDSINISFLNISLRESVCFMPEWAAWPCFCNSQWLERLRKTFKAAVLPHAHTQYPDSMHLWCPLLIYSKIEILIYNEFLLFKLQKRDLHLWAHQPAPSSHRLTNHWYDMSQWSHEEKKEAMSEWETFAECWCYISSVWKMPHLRADMKMHRSFD